ncbi:MAG: HAD family hydrolase [Desulfobacterota bacterium]|nr:HAD family hydrolase [Thermodesulfobacteriota bacterium]
MRRLILCDFDGTVSLHDLGYLLLSRFSLGNWEAIDRDYGEGKIGSREAYSQIALLLKAEESEVLPFVRSHSQIDPSFEPFARYCKESGIDLKIVSDGLDIYIRTVLEIHGLSDIPFYANEAKFGRDGTIELSFPHGNDACGRCGLCKRKIVQAHRGEYDRIYYVGNGLSDRCGARESDLVFAKDDLYFFCIEADLPCHAFDRFRDIHNDLTKKIRGVLFDLDGTLIEAYGAIYLGLQEVFQQAGRRIFPYEELGRYLKADLESTLHQFFSPEETQRWIPVMRKKYEEVYLEHTHFLDGAEETVSSLYERGLRLGVASNKFGRFSRAALQHLGVSQCFRSVLGAGDVPRNKPFPDMIHAVLRELELKPEEGIFVGDTLTDIEAGKAAGIDVYALPTGFHTKQELSRRRPKRILRHLRELIELVDRPL